MARYSVEMLLHVQLALALGIAAVPAPVHATLTSPADSQSLETRANSKTEAAESIQDENPSAAASLLTEAGQLYMRSAAEVPGSLENADQTREDKLKMALNVLSVAISLAPESLDTHRVARDAHQQMVDLLHRLKRSPEVIRGFADQLTALESRVVELTPDTETEPETVGGGDEPTPLVPSPSSSPEGPPPPLPETNKPPPMSDEPYKSPTWIRAGLWSSIALTGASTGVFLGTLFAVAREPITGVAYLKILEAARMSATVGSGEMDNMCEQARALGDDQGVTDASVVAACDHKDRVLATAIATGVIAGVSLISTAVFTSLLLKHRKRNTGRLVGATRRGAWIGVAPRHNHGVAVYSGWRF